LAGALHDIKRGGDQRTAAKGKNHGIGMQRAQATERQPRLAKIEVWPHQLRGD
jgi:hypothetical protein